MTERDELLETITLLASRWRCGTGPESEEDSAQFAARILALLPPQPKLEWIG